MENRIKELRAKHNLTQEKLAKLLSVSRQTIIMIEQGKFNPSLDLSFKLSTVFNESIEKIFIRSEPSIIEEHHKRGYR